MKAFDASVVRDNISAEMERAQNAEELGATFYYSALAICAGLAGIAKGLEAINENILEIARDAPRS